MKPCVQTLSLIGQTFNRLTVLSLHHKDQKSVPFMLCRCECGTELLVRAAYIHTGHTKSCGCWQKDYPNRNIQHGMTGTPTHTSYGAMIQRCTNPNDPSWESYGGRGITVCDRWLHSFEAFFEDMGLRPDGTTLEREKVNQGYSPENCRWATYKEQANNRRNNNLITFEGETRNVSQWAEILGVTPQVIKWRLRQGWELSRALTEPARLKFPNGAGRNPGWKDRSKARCAERRAA